MSRFVESGLRILRAASSGDTLDVRSAKLAGTDGTISSSSSALLRQPCSLGCIPPAAQHNDRFEGCKCVRPRRPCYQACSS